MANSALAGSSGRRIGQAAHLHLTRQHVGAAVARTGACALSYGYVVSYRDRNLIDRDPKVRGGRPKIAGTGLTVSRIASWYKMGMTPEEIALEYPHLTLAQVHAALAYYHINRDEIEADFAHEAAAASEWKQQFGDQSE